MLLSIHTDQKKCFITTLTQFHLQLFTHREIGALPRGTLAGEKGMLEFKPQPCEYLLPILLLVTLTDFETFNLLKPSWFPDVN